ncbi:NUDIX domain-containing protein [Prolixibacteraceae bacterium JC049]|nr:NUDIX domain-containing protein [Prolixibacteraceae bacterium JC049]
MKITVGNVCFIIDKANDRMLLLKRSFEPMQGQYTGVGGKTKFDEDVHASCVREVKEETGLDVKDLKLKGVLKTLLEGAESSWLLFVYTSDHFEGELIDCPEGELEWIDMNQLDSIKLIGFIEEIMPFVLNETGLLEGTIWHNSEGEVIKKQLKPVLQ